MTKKSNLVYINMSLIRNLISTQNQKQQYVLIIAFNLLLFQVLQEDVYTDSKYFKQQKTQHVKKNIDHLVIVQKDLQNCVQEYQKSKKFYDEEVGVTVQV